MALVVRLIVYEAEWNEEKGQAEQVGLIFSQDVRILLTDSPDYPPEEVVRSATYLAESIMKERARRPARHRKP